MGTLVTPQQFRKRPVVIEAMQCNGHDEACAAMRWCGGQLGYKDDPGLFYIQTLEGQMWVTPDDWVIKGVQGEFYPCKPDIFAITYEAV